MVKNPRPIIKRQIKRFRKVIRTNSMMLVAKCALGIETNNPNFLVIGAARSATGWLHKRLSLHPLIYLPPKKEVHFFDQRRFGGDNFYFDLSNQAHWRWYWLNFFKAKNKIKGDITPAYSILPEQRIKNIFEFLPNTKIVYSVRNPVERAWSGLRHRLWYGSGMKPHQFPDHILLGKMKQPEILAKGDYITIIKRWENHFPKSQIHYLFYDDIILDPRKVLNKLCKFLTIDPRLLPNEKGDHRRVNTTPGSEIPKAVFQFLCAYYSNQIPFLEEKFQRNFNSWNLEY